MVGQKGRVVASDILPMEPIDGVDFVQGDFTELDVYEQIVSVLGESKVDLVISDMAPNMSGVSAVDQPKAMYLVELAVDMAEQILSPGGGLVAKVFHGDGFDELLRTARSKFNKVQVRKPDASRARSKEQYLVALGYKG